MEVFRYCCPFQNNLQHEMTVVIKVKQFTNILFRFCCFLNRQEQLNGLIKWLHKLQNHV